MLILTSILVVFCVPPSCCLIGTINNNSTTIDIGTQPIPEDTSQPSRYPRNHNHYSNFIDTAMEKKFAIFHRIFKKKSSLTSDIFDAPQWEELVAGKIGQLVDIKDFPYQLSLRISGVQICGASIISSIMALTSAHCVSGVKPQKLTFRAGSNFRDSEGVIHYAVDIIIHPLFSGWEHDIAIVRVEPSFLRGLPGISPIRLAMVEPAVGSKVLVTGYASSFEGGSYRNRLHSLRIQVLQRTNCKTVYGQNITENDLCIKAPLDINDFCIGDAGNPIIDMNHVQVGIISSLACIKDYNHAGINIAAYKSWITQIAGFF